MKHDIIRHIPTDCPWKGHIHVFDIIGSTNTYLKEVARKGAPEGTVVIARNQTDGRGRLGRIFHSPTGKGIYFSLLLRPDLPAESLMHLTCAVGVAVCNAVESVTGFRPGIKWINDLVAGSKKAGGILTELSFGPTGNVAYAVIGIGINCSHTPEDFPPELQDIATSLAQYTGRPCDQSKLIAELIAQLYNMYGTLVSSRKQIMEAYRKDCITLGKEIQVIQGDIKEIAKALDVLDDGSLLVRYANGHETAVNSGEVTVRGMYGYIS